MAQVDSTDFFRPIPDCPGYYAGRDGWIYSTWKRKMRRSRSAPIVSIPDAKPPTRLACAEMKRDGKYIGYRHVILGANGQQFYSGGIHRLILLAFVGPPPEGDYQAAHEDGNPSNNCPENLSWKTPKENQADRKRHGTFVHALGEDANHKLTENQIRSIRERYASGTVTQKQLAKEYGIHQVTVSEIVLRKIWRHI